MPRQDDESRANTIEIDQWSGLDFSSLKYYAAGTTSFILTCTTIAPKDESGGRDELVLKCVLFPWNKLTAIAQATDDYAIRYGSKVTAGVVVHPIASTDRWVLMPFQSGPTLTEHLKAFEKRGPSVGDRVGEARRLGMILGQALHELAGEGPVDPTMWERQHLDLSPSNIILPKAQTVRFIDLGPNHLYSRQVGIAEHDDAVYISPEVKNRGRSVSSDAYSLAIILIQVLTGEPPRDGRVPNAVYELSPTLGRFFDDFLEEDQHNRLLLLPEEPFSFDRLMTSLDSTFEMAAQEPETSSSTGSRWVARLLPASREVWTQFRRVRKTFATQGMDRAVYLLGFSLISTTAWWFIFAKTFLFKLDDVVTLSVDELPQGDLRAAYVIALSQGLVAAKYYQMVLARLTALSIPGGLSRITEALVRSMSVVAVPTLLLSVYWRPQMWAWGCAAGAVAVAMANLALVLLTTRTLEVGARNGLSTVPPMDRSLSRGFEQWWWSMLLYAVVIIVIATGLQSGFMKDRDAYVFGLVLISVGIHYISKFVVAGYAVRGGLARALSVGERLAALEQRCDGKGLRNWPPRLLADDKPIMVRLRNLLRRRKESFGSIFRKRGNTLSGDGARET